LRATAYHEAGHAVTSCRLALGFKRVTVQPGTDSWGHVLSHRLRLTDEHVYNMSPAVRDRLERKIVVLLSGREAERIVRGRYNNRGAGSVEFSPGSDYSSALELASHIVEMSSEEFAAYFKWLRLRAKALTNSPINRVMIDEVAAALIERTTLTERQVRDAMWTAGQRLSGQAGTEKGQSGSLSPESEGETSRIAE
jgi:hypothetical protein